MQQLGSGHLTCPLTEGGGYTTLNRENTMHDQGSWLPYMVTNVGRSHCTSHIHTYAQHTTCYIASRLYVVPMLCIGR